MVYGYARFSMMGLEKNDNSLEAQINLLRQAGAERIFQDVYSGKPKHHPQLDELLNIIEYGDKFIITKLDRIARGLVQGVRLLETLGEKGVIVEVLNMGVIDNTPTGRLIRNILLILSEFEHDVIGQRSKEGKIIAGQKVKRSQARKFSHIQIDHALELLETHTCKQVERLTGISKATIYNEKRKRKANKQPASVMRTA